MQNGTCKYGDTCKFKHTKEAVDAARNKYQARKAAAVIAHNSEGEDGTFVMYTEHWIDEPYDQPTQEYEGYDGYEGYGVGEEEYGYDEWGHDDTGQPLAVATPAVYHGGWDAEYYEGQDAEYEEQAYGQTDDEYDDEDEEEEDDGEGGDDEEDDWQESAGESSAESQA